MDHPHTGWMNVHVYCLNILMQNKDMYISCVLDISVFQDQLQTGWEEDKLVRQTEKKKIS